MDVADSTFLSVVFQVGTVYELSFRLINAQRHEFQHILALALKSKKAAGNACNRQCSRLSSFLRSLILAVSGFLRAVALRAKCKPIAISIN
jgi:hypothetical protein